MTTSLPRLAAATLAVAGLALTTACSPAATTASVSSAPASSSAPTTSEAGQPSAPTPSATTVTDLTATPQPETVTAEPSQTVTVVQTTAAAPTTVAATKTTAAQPTAAQPTVAGYRPASWPDVAKQPSLYYMDSGNGTYGCGDKPVAATQVARSGTPVRDAMTQLLATKKREVGMSGLVNGLADSSLTYADGKVDHAAGVVDVWLKGQIRPGGTCDVPRIQAQLELTALSAAQVKGVRIWINGKPLPQVLKAGF